MIKKKDFIQAVSLAAGLVLVVLAGLKTGPAEYGWDTILQGLSGQDEMASGIVLDLRLPRVILALISGAALTLGGFFMQALIKNPLADPYIMGVSTGAGFGVNLIILGLIPVGVVSAFTYPIGAFIGGGISLILVLLLGIRALKEDTARLLIAGIAVSALFQALTGVAIYEWAEDDQIRKILFWTFGSFDKAGWEGIMISGGFFLVAWIAAMIVGNRLDVLILGDRQAKSLGMKVPHMKLLILFLTVTGVGASIAFTGPIGFVGMMIPHFSRAINGLQHRKNLIFGVIAGGIYLAGCDVLSRIIHPPAGFPIGIVTAILGVPFFIYLLYSRKNRQVI